MFLLCSCPPRPTPLIHPPSPAARPASSASSASSSTTARNSPPRSASAPSPTPSPSAAASAPSMSRSSSHASPAACIAPTRSKRGYSSADRLDAAPRGPASPARPRAPRPAAAPAAGEADARLIHLPTPEQIAAKVRRQPIGAVIADICRDLGILPSHKLWRELQHAIIREGGSYANLVEDILDQVFPLPATPPPARARGSPALA